MKTQQWLLIAVILVSGLYLGNYFFGTNNIAKPEVFSINDSDQLGLSGRRKLKDNLARAGEQKVSNKNQKVSLKLKEFFYNLSSVDEIEAKIFNAIDNGEDLSQFVIAANLVMDDVAHCLNKQNNYCQQFNSDEIEAQNEVNRSRLHHSLNYSLIAAKLVTLEKPNLAEYLSPELLMNAVLIDHDSIPIRAVDLFLLHNKVGQQQIVNFVERSAQLDNKSKVQVFKLLGQDPRIQADESLYQQWTQAVAQDIFVRKNSSSAQSFVNELANLGLRKNDFVNLASQRINSRCRANANTRIARKVFRQEMADLQSQARRKYNVQELNIHKGCI